MKAGALILKLQRNLGIPLEKRFPHIGPLTREHFEYLATLGPEDEYDPKQLEVQTVGVAHPINERAVQLIQHFESCYLRAYRDEVGVWTIGWGHTGLQHQDGTVYEGRVITQAQADNLFRYDMHQFEERVSALVKVPLTEDQYGALVSFDFNTGSLHRATMLKLLNLEDYERAADELLKWNRAGGRVLDGLTRRRRSERRLFLGMDYFVLEDMHEVELDAEGKLSSTGKVLA